MKYVYHGTNIENIDILKTKNGILYATPSKAIALIFLSKKGNDFYYYLSGDGVNYPVVLVERKKDMFKEIFNISGFIYKLDAKDFKENQTGWSGEVICDHDVNVLSCEYIDNVYDELLKLSKENKIKLYLYPNRPKNVPLDNSDLIKKVIRWSKKGFDVNKFFELYPELKDKFLDEINDNK